MGKIGTVKSRSGKSFEVSWETDRHVYVKGSGFMDSNTKVGKASSAGEAMTKAEAFVYNK